jgi:hypothetical protein
MSKREKIYQFIASKLPKYIVMFCYVRVIALVWSKLNIEPNQITYDKAFEVMKKEWKI